MKIGRRRLGVVDAFLYEVCFDEETATAIYTKHCVKPPTGEVIHFRRLSK